MFFVGRNFKEESSTWSWGGFEVESCVVAFRISMAMAWKVPTVAHPHAPVAGLRLYSYFNPANRAWSAVGSRAILTRSDTVGVCVNL